MRTMLAPLLAAALLAGCADPDKPLELTVKGDTFCELAEKQTWSVRDTRPSITNARRANAKYDCTCLTPKPAYCVSPKPTS